MGADLHSVLLARRAWLGKRSLRNPFLLFKKDLCFEVVNRNFVVEMPKYWLRPTGGRGVEEQTRKRRKQKELVTAAAENPAR